MSQATHDTNMPPDIDELIGPILIEAKAAFFAVLEAHACPETSLDVLWNCAVANTLVGTLLEPEIDPEGFAEAVNEEIAAVGWRLVRTQ